MDLYLFMMNRNYLWQTFLFVLFTVLGLLLLGLMPDVVLGGERLRRVDILSDVRPGGGSAASLAVDSVAIVDSLLRAEMVVAVAGGDSLSGDSAALGDGVVGDSVPVVRKVVPAVGRGGLGIVDPEGDMGAFYAALDEAGSRPVRIAYFGDSFVEGDIFTGDLRRLLQKEFGGGGVGFVPVTSATSGFRRTVRHDFKGWESHVLGSDSHFDAGRQSVAGSYFIPVDSVASVHLSSRIKGRGAKDTCDISYLFFKSEGGVMLRASDGRGDAREFVCDGSRELNREAFVGHFMDVEWSVEGADSSALFYGATMETRTGVVLDNFSSRGSSGMHLSAIPRSMMSDFFRLRHYDLVVLHYGLNVATAHQIDYNYYRVGMRNVVRYIRETFPGVSVLIVGIGDREYRSEDDGELHTMPGVKSLMLFQQKAALDSGAAFWNLYDAMGGEGSIVRMVEDGMANKDYTHISFAGGRRLSKLLFDALMDGYEGRGDE